MVREWEVRNGERGDIVFLMVIYGMVIGGSNEGRMNLTGYY